MSSVTDAPLERRATPDPFCNKPGSGWKPNNIKSPSSLGVNVSHYRTISFLGPIIADGDQWTDLGNSSGLLMHTKEESDCGFHAIHIHVARLRNTQRWSFEFQ